MMMSKERWSTSPNDMKIRNHTNGTRRSIFELRKKCVSFHFFLGFTKWNDYGAVLRLRFHVIWKLAIAGRRFLFYLSRFKWLNLCDCVQQNRTTLIACHAMIMITLNFIDLLPAIMSAMHVGWAGNAGIFGTSLIATNALDKSPDLKRTYSFLRSLNLQK